MYIVIIAGVVLAAVIVLVARIELKRRAFLRAIEEIDAEPERKEPATKAPSRPRYVAVALAPSDDCPCESGRAFRGCHGAEA